MDQFGIADYVSWLLGLVFFIASIYAAFAIGKRNKQRPELRSAIDFAAISQNHKIGPKVKVSFDGIEYDSVGRTRIAVWNARGDDVRWAHVVDSDKLRLEVPPNSTILQARVVSQSRKQISLHVNVSGTNAFLSFDFLDHEDGGVVELLHTGTEPAKIAGTLRGVDFSTPREASLGPGARKAVRSQVWNRAKYMTPKGRRLRKAFFFVLAFSAGAVALSLVLILDLLREPALLDPSLYDLTQLSGQEAFATDVRKSGSLTWQRFVPLILLFSMSVGLAIATIRQLQRMTRAVIPQSIVTDDMDTEPQKPNPSVS